MNDLRVLIIAQIFATIAGAFAGYMAIREDLAIIKTRIEQHEKILDKLEQRK